VSGRVNLRPLLGIQKVEIVAALRAAGLPWCEDATNQGDSYFRNRVRRSVVPAWQRAAQRDAVAGAALSRTLLDEDDAALEAWLAEVAPITPGGALSLRRLAGRPRGLVRRALRRWLAGGEGVGEISRQAFEALLDDVMAGRSTWHSLGRTCFAQIGRRQVVFRKNVPAKKPQKFHARSN
jgi:tRNA(Ile)-lysidine synthase